MWLFCFGKNMWLSLVCPELDESWGDSWGSWSSLTQSWPFWLIATEVAVGFSGLHMWIRESHCHIWSGNCIFSFFGVYFGHSLACERLINSEKAQIPDLYCSVIVNNVNCIVRSPWCCHYFMVEIIGWESVTAFNRIYCSVKQIHCSVYLDRIHWTNVIITVIKQQLLVSIISTTVGRNPSEEME